MSLFSSGFDSPFDSGGPLYSEPNNAKLSAEESNHLGYLGQRDLDRRTSWWVPFLCLVARKPASAYERGGAEPPDIAPAQADDERAVAVTE
jgi:hypothetical protein